MPNGQTTNDVGDTSQDSTQNEEKDGSDQSDTEEAKEDKTPEKGDDEKTEDDEVPEEKKVDEVTKDLEEAALNDLDDLDSYLLEIIMVPDIGDEEKIADKPVEYNKWAAMWVYY